MYLYEGQFSEAHDFPEVAYEKVLVIASTPRCGSHMLGHALHDTGAFGFPLEYANSQNRPRWEARFGSMALTELIKTIARHRTSPNKVFAIKVHYEHLRELGGFAELRKLFPEAGYVLLSRNDVLKQAISFALAKQTGVWIAGQRPVVVEPTYSFDEINRCLRELLKQNAAWRYQLAAHGCRKLELEFGAVAADVGSAIAQVASFMDIDLAQATQPPGHATSAQGNRINRDWERRFLDDFEGGDLFGAGHQAQQPLLKRVVRWAW